MLLLSRTQLSDFPVTFLFHALEKEMATHSSVVQNNKNNRCYFYFCLFQCASFLYRDPHFWPSFPSAWRVSFNIFCGIGLWAMNALSFCFSKKVFISSFWKNNFTSYRILDYWSFYFNVLNISFIKKEKIFHSFSFCWYGFWWESESEVAQLCPTLCDPVGCSLPGCSVRGILQAKILEWVTISFSRGSYEKFTVIFFLISVLLQIKYFSPCVSFKILPRLWFSAVWIQYV